MRTEQQRKDRRIIDALRRKVKDLPAEDQEAASSKIDTLAATYRRHHKMETGLAAMAADQRQRVRDIGLVHVVEVLTPGFEEAKRLHSEVQVWLTAQGAIFADTSLPGPFVLGPNACVLLAPTFRGAVAAAFAGPDLALAFKMRFG